jgi:3-oxoadipate enol-lactonase
MAYVRTRLGRLFVEERGMWRGQIEPLSALGRVVVIDGPGAGKSEPPPRFMLEEHADALFDAWGELGIDKAIIVGISWGGMVGMRFALQHPTCVSGLAILDSSAETHTLAERVRYRAFIALHKRAGLPYSLFDREVAPKLFGPTTRRTRPELALRSYQHVMGFNRDGVAKSALAVMIHRKNILEKISAIRVPTLVMVGREDTATPLDKSENIARSIPGAELVVLDDVGHMCALEDPDAVNARLVPFVKRLIESR